MSSKIVALRKESVDRNHAAKYRRIPLRVALRKESVDRNTMRRDFKALCLLSLSARRAWIEIQKIFKKVLTSMCRSPQGERG